MTDPAVGHVRTADQAHEAAVVAIDLKAPLEECLNGVRRLWQVLRRALHGATMPAQGPHWPCWLHQLLMSRYLNTQRMLGPHAPRAPHAHRD